MVEIKQTRITICQNWAGRNNTVVEVKQHDIAQWSEISKRITQWLIYGKWNYTVVENLWYGEKGWWATLIFRLSVKIVVEITHNGRNKAECEI